MTVTNLIEGGCYFTLGGQSRKGPLNQFVNENLGDNKPAGQDLIEACSKQKRKEKKKITPAAQALSWNMLGLFEN